MLWLDTKVDTTGAEANPQRARRSDDSVTERVMSDDVWWVLGDVAWPDDRG